jgi:hypothetical protein
MHEATPRNRRRTGDNIGDRHRWMPGELHHCGLADPDAGVITAAVNELSRGEQSLDCLISSSRAVACMRASHNGSIRS